MRQWAWLLLASTVMPTPAPAQEAPLEPRTTAPVRDADFGVSTRQFGLDRRVEMLQWQRTREGYRRVWHDARIDDAGHAPGHANPPEIELPSRRWWSDSAQLRGRPVDPAVLRELGTWHPFRPDFAALPANLAVTFQPEGDGLGSALNPLEPGIGDMRVTWRELRLPPLEGRVELRGGRWSLREAPPTAAEPVVDEAPGVLPAPVPAAPEPSASGERAPRPWPWVGAVLALGVLVLLVRGLRVRRAVRRRASGGDGDQAS